MIQVNIHQAKTQLSDLLERVQNGEEVIIAKAGTPIATLNKITRKPRIPGSLAGKFTFDKELFDQGDQEIQALFEASPIFLEKETLWGYYSTPTF